ncbi:alcohol dehydrogenase catalytic domain-containing protein [Kocuria sabuli]|uniref:alcohol dehydrogenase catalytic domain-containing protein n=1 Tax=Kocuria sabuli TaxID=3071448 RepID=UPI0034D4BD5C
MVGRAVAAERFGPPQQVLHLTTLVHPDPLSHQLTVRTTAAALNPSGLIPVTGTYPSRTPSPFIPGHESVGVILPLGGDCEGWAVGQRVIPIGTAGDRRALRGGAMPRNASRSHRMRPIPWPHGVASTL